MEPSATGSPWPSADTRYLRPRKLQPRDPSAELKLRHALAAFDRAASPQESRVAEQRLRQLGPEVVPSVVAELASPQPPERLDLLLDVLVAHENVDGVIDVAESAEAGAVLQAALAMALARFAEAVHSRDDAVRDRIASALLVLVGNADVGVRVTAIEAIGLAGLRGRRIAEVLRRAAEDPSPSVREEARALLSELA